MKDFPSHDLLKKKLCLVFLGGEASAFKDKFKFLLLKVTVGRVEGTGKLTVTLLKLK